MIFTGWCKIICCYLRKVLSACDRQVVVGLLEQVQSETDHVVLQVAVPVEVANVEREESLVRLGARLVQALRVVVGELPLPRGEVRQNVAELVDFGIEFGHSAKRIGFGLDHIL